jgi:hypothetical protein
MKCCDEYLQTRGKKLGFATLLLFNKYSSEIKDGVHNTTLL